MSFAAFAEGGAGNDGDALGHQEAFAELFAGKPRFLDGREGVKGTVRLAAGKTEIAKAFNDQLAADIVFLFHMLDVGVGGAKSFHGGRLRGGRGTHNGVLVDLGDDRDQGRGGAGVAKPPARHSERLREAVDRNGALPHTVDGGDGGVRRAEGKLGIDLVGDHENFSIAEHLGNCFEVGALHNCARRVGRVGHNQRLSARGYEGAQLVGGDLEAVFRLGVQNYGNTARKTRNGLVADVARLRNDDLVAGVGDGADGDVDGFTAADGNENFVFWIVLKVVFAGEITRDLIAQLLRSSVRRVARLSVLKRVNARHTDMPGGTEIGLANAEGYDVFHRVRNVEEASDTRRLDIACD